jgi:hypothetical protein
MTITYGVGVIIEVMIIVRKLKVISNSFLNSLFFYSYSKVLISFVMDARKANGSTYIAPISLTCFAFSFSTYFFLKNIAFLSSSFPLASHFNFSKVFSLMAFDNINK